jgi:hypothetical protein
MLDMPAIWAMLLKAFGREIAAESGLCLAWAFGGGDLPMCDKLESELSWLF